MKRCPECGRGGGKGTKLTAPALLTLAAGEVADGLDMADETIEHLILLRKELRRAEQMVDMLIEDRAQKMIATPYRESKIAAMRRRIAERNR